MENIELDYIRSSPGQHPDVNLEDNSHPTENINDAQGVASKTDDSESNFSPKSLPTKWAVLGSVLYIIIAATIGILIVIFTTHRPRIVCHVTVIEAMSSSTTNDSYPVSITVNDFNNDSWLDIVIANSGTDKIAVFLGYGNGSFSAPTTYSTGTMSRPVSAAAGDINHDHWMDVIVANYDSHSVGVLLNHGDGTFADPVDFFIGSSRPLSIAAGDLNNDTWLDIVTSSPAIHGIGVLFGNENGSFEMLITYSTGYDSLPYSIAIGDFNNDHWLDVAVANYGTNNIGIFLGYGNGTLAPQVTFSTGRGSGPRSITIVDCNNDHRLDIIVANYDSDSVGIFFGYGNGTFAKQAVYPLGLRFRPSFVAIGYINGDNQLDIVVSNNGTNSVSVILGYGNGTFAAPTTHLFTTGSDPSALAVGDFNNDKQSDVAVSNSGTNKVIVLIGYMRISSENPKAYSTGKGSNPKALAISDLNNDNYLDIAVAHYDNDSIGILFGYGNGSFREQISFDNGGGSQPYQLRIGDFNNDHFPDIAVANRNSGHLSVLLGYGNGSFAAIKAFTFQESLTIQSIAVGDFNSDQQLDIVLTDFGHDAIMILLGYGNGSFKYAGSYPTGRGSRPYFAEVGDFNNDEHLDIVIANYGTNNVGIFLGYGNGTFISQTIYFTGYAAAPTYIAVEDISSDNCLDIAVVNNGVNNIGVLLGYCNGSFATQTIVPTGSRSAPSSVTISDVNDDNWLDLIVTNSNLGTLGIFLGYGNGSFPSQLAFSTGLHSGSVAAVVGDFNNDKRMDVAVANSGTNSVAVLLGHPVTSPNSTDGFLLGNYYSDFTSGTSHSTGSSLRPYSIAAGDFNNDTQLDIVVSNSGAENIGILLGQGNGLFTSERTYSLGSNSAPQQVLVRDFNRDNWLDVVVSNLLGDSISVFLGNGNGSFAQQLIIQIDSGSKPSSIASGDLNNDGWLDLVVMNTGTNTIDFLFGFQYASFQYPIRSTTGDYSSANSVAVGDLNNDGRLDVVTANYGLDNVGVLLGYGNGSFTQPVMFANVSGSHPWAVAIADFNSDGRSDITVAMWGLNQIGVLLGNGDGTFGEPRIYSTDLGIRPVDITVGDFNNDNHVDIATANYGTDTVSVYLGYGNGTFRNALVFSTGNGSRPASVSVTDVNKDHNLDIIVANEVASNVGVLYGNGDGTFKNLTTYSAKPSASPQYALSGDFNNDSLPDLAVSLPGSSDIGVFLGYGNETFSPIMLYSVGLSSGPHYLALGDLNNSSYIDIIVVNVNTHSIGVLFGNGDGTFKSIVLYYTDSSALISSIAIADFNNDTIDDIVFIDSIADEVAVLFRNGFQPFGSYTSLAYVDGSNPSSVAVGDLNHDTYLDIVIANIATDNIGILLGHGNGTFEDVKTYSTGKGSKPLSIALGDFNNDSLLDIAVANSNTNNVGILLSSNNEILRHFETFSTGIVSYPVSVAVGDFNTDGIPDIAVTNAGTNNVGIFIGYGNGSFADQRSYPMRYDSRPNAAVFGNFNNDSWIDIAVVNHATDNINILLNCPPV